jgi:hypothetical protein
MLHFDNAPVHNTKGVQESLVNVRFRRIEHPSHSADLAARDFFLFNAIKQTLAEQHFDTGDDLCIGMEAFLGQLSADFLQTVFPECIRQLQLCRESGGEYFE